MHAIDITIIVLYMLLMVAVGWIVAKLAARNAESYFLAGKSLPWWIIGVAHGSSGIDITGTMWFVMMLFLYGAKAAWLLWVWPLFNVVFRMVYLGPWVRRSNVLTGAEWMRTRFGEGRGSQLAYLSVVIYALLSVVGFLCYAFRGIGKFVVPFIGIDLGPWAPYAADIYGTIILLVTGLYCVVGGMYSVVLNDLIQYTLILIAAVIIAWIAMANSTAQQIAAATPAGWDSILPTWNLHYDWGAKGLPAAERIINDPFPGGHGYSLFFLFVAMIFVRGVITSMAGPTPNYAIQHVLSTKSPREAALENMFMAVVSLAPRFLLIAGITVIGLIFLKPDIQAQMATKGVKTDFEQILPTVVNHYVPVGAKGLILAGLLAAFMSTYVSTVNSGVAYIVNDVYKRYVNPQATSKQLVKLGYIYSVVIIVAGIIFGVFAPSVHTVTEWIVAALVPAFVIPNVIKWHWWRFNGWGFFAGMAAGTAAAMLVLVLPPMRKEWISMLVMGVSAIASFAACLATAPEEMGVLKSFYRSVKPWGFWNPVYRAILVEDPAFTKNRELGRDLFNLTIGLVWQVSMVALPIYFVIKNWGQTWLWLGTLVGSSLILKLTWYDKLGPGEMYTTPDGQAPKVEDAPVAGR